MATIKQSLDELMKLDGILCIAVVDSRSVYCVLKLWLGMLIGIPALVWRGGCDILIVVRARRARRAHRPHRRRAPGPRGVRGRPTVP